MTHVPVSLLAKNEGPTLVEMSSASQISGSLSHRRQQLIIWSLLSIFPFLGMAVDLIAPSLPSISKSLHVSTEITKNIISIYLLGYALGNFFTGFLTDALGRKKLLCIHFIGFIASSLLPVFHPQIEFILLSRLLQGITIGSLAVIARAIFSDVLPMEKLVTMGILIGSMFGIGPVIGPFLGGYLQFYFGWQSCFIFFALVILVIFIPIFFIVPETYLQRHALNIKLITHHLAEVMNHKKFMGMVIMMGAVYSLAIAFNTVGPFLIQTRLHYSPVFFGKIALCMGLSFLVATLACRYLLRIYHTDKLFFVATNGFFLVAILAVIAGYFFESSIMLLCIASTMMFFANGFIFPMSMGNGLSLFRHIAGTATALAYLINVLMTSAVAFLLSFIDIQNVLSLFLVYLLLMAICTTAYWRLVRET